MKSLSEIKRLAATSPQTIYKRLHELEEKLERAREVLDLIASPERLDGTYNRDRKACEELAREALESLKK